jgi:hypothetical protein
MVAMTAAAVVGVVTLRSDQFVRGAIAGRSLRFAERLAFVPAISYAAFLAASFAGGIWLIDTDGHGIQTDFINVWAAGRLVLEGDPASAYDWVIHKAVEEQGVGHPFEKYFGWHYPPTFLFVAAVLSLLPYMPAFLAWMAVTLPAYVTVIRVIVGNRIGVFLACAFPGALWNMSTGQNGFLTAALLGGSLVAAEKQPVLAGMFIGLLSYKPQFGIMFPLVLAVSREWRIFAVATLTTALLVLASWLAFGLETWQAFVHYLPLTSQVVLGDGLAGFRKLQTTFGFVRWCGGNEALAWTLHCAMTVACLMTVSLIWRQRLAYEIKAAALGIAVLLATPYLYTYDLVALAVPMAFVVRIGLRERFMAYEIAGFALVGVLVLLVPITGIPSGFAAVLLVAALIIRRVVADPQPLLTSGALVASGG